LFFIIFLFHHYGIFAQSPQSLAIGNASSTLNNEWSLFHNPAGLAWEDGTFVISSYINHLFISSLDDKSVGFGIRKNKKGLGFSIRQNGDHRLKESYYSIVYSQLFAGKFSMGISIHYRNISFGDIYGNKGVFYGSFGFLLKYDEVNYISFQIINPSREVIDPHFNERQESKIRSGYSHIFSDKFSINTELEKGLESKFNFKTGFRYNMNENSVVSMGYEMAFRRISLGLNLKINKITGDLAFSYESHLGFRTGIGISYTLSKK